MNLFKRPATGQELKAIDSLKQRGFSSPVINVLNNFIARAAERELYQANPRHWAEQIGLDERTMLALIVAGVQEGLFELAWQTVCPICKLYNRTSTSLGGIIQMHYCEKCNHDFEAYLDEEIILTVSVTEALRRLSPTKRLDPVFRDWVDVHYGQVPALALILLPAFQELSDQQTLPEGQSLGVKRLTVFFSSLRGSTALYHKHSDVLAYRWVSEHSKILFDAAARHNGTVVKTIGDGVMGVFPDPANALRAVADALAGLARLNTQAGLTGDDALTLKVGLHAGPCLVVTLNERLDYFGETVNVAARLSELAQGNDVVISQAILNDAVRGALAKTLGELQPLAAKLPGLPEDFEFHRLIPAAATEESLHS
jgi:class 3 adenylate cyclase